MAVTTPPVAELQEQLLTDQAPSAKTRTDYFNAPALQSLIGPNGRSSRKLPLSVLYEMETNAILQFADLIAMSNIVMGNWKIECKSARKAQFLDQALRRIYGRLILQFFGARRFGYQGIVKEFARMRPTWEYFNKDTQKAELVWTDQSIDALVWDSFVPLRPELIEPIWSGNGSFNGIRIKNVSGGFFIQGVTPILMPPAADTNSSSDYKVDLDHSLWVVNERDGTFGSMWGRSRYTYAYDYWRASKMTLAILNRAVERKGDPTIVVSYPIGKSRMANGETIDNQVIAEQIGRQARSGSVLLIPSNAWGEDAGEEGKGASKWKVDTVKTEAEFERLESILGYLDVMMFRAMNVGEQSVIEGRGGTSSRNVAAVVGERTAEAQFYTQIEYDEIINRYMIPQLSAANFSGPERDEPARKVTQTFGQGQVDLLSTLIQSMANSDANLLNIDWDAVIDILGMPLKTPAEIERAKEKVVESAPQAPAPVAPDNGNAGVTDTGFYVDDRERIELADDEALLASLPATKHYSDRTVLAQTRSIRKVWADLLADQIEDFAKHVEHGDVNLEEMGIVLASGDDEDKRARKVADAVVKSWRYTKGIAAAIKNTYNALNLVFSRAGQLELQRSSLTTDEWNPQEKDLAKWVKDNAGVLVRRIEETTRKQLNTYLYDAIRANHNAPQIAAGIREHFAEFPSWRADLIAREEVRKFYNAATLFAAQSAKVDQVQAIDARLGHERSDPICIKRNGRFFSIDEAFQEEAKTHPRDTLAWRMIKKGVKLELLPEEELGAVGARYSSDEGIIYLSEELTDEMVGEYLCQVGQWIEARS